MKKHNEKMNGFKRALCALAAVCLLLGLVACASTPNDKEGATTAVEVTTERPSVEAPTNEKPTTEKPTGETPTKTTEAPTAPPATPAPPIELPEREI